MGDKTIYCIRHGESTYNAWRTRSLWTFSWVMVRDPMILDAPLSEKGEQQVKELYKTIEDQHLHDKIELIIASPLTRAIQTTLGGFRGCKTPILLDPVCREQLDTACDIGRQREELSEAFNNELIDFSAVEPFWWLAPEKRPPNSPVEPPATSKEVLPLREISSDVNARIHEFIKKLAMMPQTHIAVVGHSSYFKRMLGMNRKLNNCELFSMPLSEIAEQHGIELSQDK